MIKRVAFLSLHTSPLVQPGAGDAGGMNVYIDELARAMVGRGVEVDVFTRAPGRRQEEVTEVVPGYRVVCVPAGPPTSLTIAELPITVEPFSEGVIARGGDFDLVHSHYWLSGWAGLLVKRAVGIPLANSFHTLGRVKDATRRVDQPAESLLRIAAEHEVIAGSDCVIASTQGEADELTDRYGADPAKLCVNPPGVDHGVFMPGDQAAARSRLGLQGGPLVLFVGRIQPLKGLDVALEAFALLREEIPSARFVAVGGPSGPEGGEELARLRARVGELGLGSEVTFVPARPHAAVADFYRAADVLLFPSRSESFGLVAAEAQACGLPVVAAKVGGLAYSVDDGASGYLVEGWEPADYAVAMAKVLLDEQLAQRLSERAVAFSSKFSWSAAVDRLLELYSGITGAGETSSRATR